MKCKVYSILVVYVFWKYKYIFKEKLGIGGGVFIKE